MHEETSNCSDIILPRTETEQAVHEIWQDVLKVPTISVTAHFVTLGGDSLAAVRMLVQLEERFDITDWEVEDMFELPTIEQMAQKVDEFLAQAAGNTVEKKLSIREWVLRNAREGKAEYELSPGQRGQWFIQEADPSSITFNEHRAVKISGNLDVEKWQQAVRDVIKRHAVIRTLFVERDGFPKQIVHDEMTIDVPLVDAGNLTELEAQNFVRKDLMDELRTPFNLAEGPLFRFKLFKTGETMFYFYVVAHHIVVDASSLNVLNRDISTIYTAYMRNEPCDLPPLEVQYAEYADWQVAHIDTPEYRKMEEHWLNSMAKPLPVLALPFDLPRPPQNSSQGGNFIHPLPATLLEKLSRVCEQTNTSMYMVLLSAYYVLLHSVTRQKDLIVGMSFSGRTEPELQSLMGYFINTMPLRVKMDNIVSYRDLLNHVRKLLLEALPNQAYPYDMLVAKVNPGRGDDNRPMLFSTVFDQVPVSIKMQDLELEMFYGSKVSSTSDLTWNLQTAKEELVLDIAYNLSLFHWETIERIVSQYENILHTIAEDLDVPIYKLARLKETEIEVNLDELF